MGQRNRVGTHKARLMIIGLIAAFSLMTAQHVGAASPPSLSGVLAGDGTTIIMTGDHFPEAANVSLTYDFAGATQLRLVTATAGGKFTDVVAVPSGFAGTVTTTARTKRAKAETNVAPQATPTTAPTTPTTAPTTPTATKSAIDPTDEGESLASVNKKELAMQIVSTNENSSLDWKAQYGYIEYNVEGNDAENRGYTAGIIGFCTKCGDLAKLVEHYNTLDPNNPLTPFTARLNELGSSKNPSADGLGDAFVSAWKQAAADPKFQQAQNEERDRVYFNPAVAAAEEDGLGVLGQFIYYDALVMHGPGDDNMSFGGIRTAANAAAKSPAAGGDEGVFLNAFLDARNTVMKAEAGHSDTSRIDTEQRKWVADKNFTLSTPLSWSVYGEPFNIG